jgi:hypothetical protein
MSLGVFTQFIFINTTEINNIGDLKKCFELLLKKDGSVCESCKGAISDYEVIVKNIDLVLEKTSIGYIVDGDTVKAHEFSWLYNGEVKMKTGFLVDIKRDERSFVKSITFNSRRN